MKLGESCYFDSWGSWVFEEEVGSFSGPKRPEKQPQQQPHGFGHVRLWAERDLVLFLKVTHFESRLCSDQMNFLLDMAMNLGFRQTPKNQAWLGLKLSWGSFSGNGWLLDDSWMTKWVVSMWATDLGDAGDDPNMSRPEDFNDTVHHRSWAPGFFKDLPGGAWSQWAWRYHTKGLMPCSRLEGCTEFWCHTSGFKGLPKVARLVIWPSKRQESSWWCKVYRWTTHIQSVQGLESPGDFFLHLASCSVKQAFQSRCGHWPKFPSWFALRRWGMLRTIYGKLSRNKACFASDRAPKSFSYRSPIIVRRFIDPDWGNFLNNIFIIFWLVLSSPDSQNPKIEQLSIGEYRWIFCGHFEKGEITSGCPENGVTVSLFRWVRWFLNGSTRQIFTLRDLGPLGLKFCPSRNHWV